MSKSKSLRAAGAARPQQDRQPVKKGRKPPPPNETPRAAFLRLAPTRLKRAVLLIRQMGNFAEGRYDWNDKDVAQMQMVLYEAVNDMVKRYAKVQEVRAERQRVQQSKREIEVSFEP